MPQIAQRLREPAAFALLAYAALATLFHTIDFLFEPGAPCFNSICQTTKFANRAANAVPSLVSPVLAAALVGAVYLAHLGTQIKQAKIVTLVALVTAGVAAVFALIALFASFGADGGSGWGTTEDFFVGAAELAVFAIAGWLIYGWYQQHAAVKPAAPAFGGPNQQQFEQQQFQPQGQWGQPPAGAGQPQAGVPQGQGQWQPPAPASQQQPPQQWAPQPPQQPQGQPPQQGQPWGAPPPPPQQQSFGGETSDSMMTQAIPSAPKPQAAPPAPPTHQQQQAPETQQFPPVGNWTSE